MPAALLRHVALFGGAFLLTGSSVVALAPQAEAATPFPPVMPGALAVNRPADGVFPVSGLGWGHGIGLSQYGANGAAHAGLGYRQILSFYYPGTTLTSDPRSTIRVGITVDNDGSLEVGAGDGLAVSAGGVARTLPSAPSRWRVRADASGCRIESLTGARWTAYELVKGQQDGACPVTFSSPDGIVRLVLPGGQVRAYRGTVSAVHTSTTRLTTVNDVGTEDYLRSVVPSESIPSFAPAALQAQAVAARTYALRTAGTGGTYDVCDTISCQVYSGAAAEVASTDAAVAATAGRVLTYGGRLATTMFSASDGGQTVAVAGFPYLTSKPDPYDAYANPVHAWSARLPASALESRYGIKRVERLQVISRDGQGTWGGRVRSVLVEGYDATGRYKAATATGSGLAAAWGWPSHGDGLRGDFFQLGATSASAPVLPAGDDAHPFAAYEGTVLQVGSVGSAVVALQQALGIDADGVFGNGTRGAVLDYQGKRELVRDGVVGTQVWRALGADAAEQAALEPSPAPKPSPNPPPKPAPKPPTKPAPKPPTKPAPKPPTKPAPPRKYAAYEHTTVRYGSHGTAVKVLQRALRVGADGIFGPRTRSAVLRFQGEHRLARTGVVNGPVWRALGTPASAGPATSARPAAPKARYAAYERTTLRYGSRGAAVKVLQRALRVGADGIFGPRTRSAVVHFQRAHRLSANGVVTRAVWQTLGGG